METWVTYKEACELAGVSESTLRRAVRECEIATFTIGKGRVVMRSEDVLLWAEPKPVGKTVTEPFTRVFNTMPLAAREPGDSLDACVVTTNQRTPGLRRAREGRRRPLPPVT